MLDSNSVHAPIPMVNPVSMALDITGQWIKTHVGVTAMMHDEDIARVVISALSWKCGDEPPWTCTTSDPVACEFGYEDDPHDSDPCSCECHDSYRQFRK